MSKDYSTVSLLDSPLTGTKLAMEADKRCHEALVKVMFWSPETIPYRLLISSQQFTELAALAGDVLAKPTGKEIFKTRDGYIFEIKVEERV